MMSEFLKDRRPLVQDSRETWSFLKDLLGILWWFSMGSLAFAGFSGILEGFFTWLKPLSAFCNCEL